MAIVTCAECTEIERERKREREEESRREGEREGKGEITTQLYQL